MVVNVAKLAMPKVDDDVLEIVDSVAGGGGTDFGVPSAITDADRRRVTAAEARRLASLVEAAWIVFDRVAAGAPPVLRKGRAVAVATATR